MSENGDPEELNPEALDLFVETSRRGIENQLHDVDAMDTKSIQVFAAATVMIPLAGLAERGGGQFTNVCFIAALGAYVFACTAAVWGLWVRNYFKPYFVDQLWAEPYKSAPSEEVKKVLVERMAKDYCDNRETLKRKACACQAVIVATGFEGVLFGVALIAPRL